MCDRQSDPSQHDPKPATRECGCKKDGPLCACVKVKREPITPREAWLLLSRSQ